MGIYKHSCKFVAQFFYFVQNQFKKVNLTFYFYIFYMTYYKEQKNNTHISQQQDYFLQPMFEKLPPNEIISEKYQPDISAHMKLILNKDQRRNNLNFVPPKTKNLQLLNYANFFNMFDYLGKKYAEKINQIVYLKFNNSKYNVDPTQKHLTRIMPAFYIPFQHIYNTSQAFFTKNMGFNFPQASNCSHLPNIKSNKGCSFDPIFNSNYESSNLFAALRKNPFEYELVLQNDINSCQKVNWFNFVIQFSSEGYYSFNIVNMTTDMSKLFDNGMKISYCYLNNFQSMNNKKTGEGWSLCGENIKFTKSNTERQNKRGQTYYQLYFQFKCKNKHDILMFAFQPPYTSIQCQKYFNNTIFKRIKNMMILEKIQYGKTISGSTLYSYVFKRKKPKNQTFKQSSQNFQINLQPLKHRKSVNLLPINKLTTAQVVDNRNKCIVILARIEGSDISGSFILQGIVDYLLQNIEYQSLKKTIDFYFVPMINVDSIKYGNSSANLTGSILQKNWRNPHKIYQSQIFCLKQFLNEINKQTPINLIINLTTENEDIYSSIISVKNDSEQIQDSRVFPYVLSRRHRLFSYEKCYFYNKNENNSMCCVLNDTFPKSLIYQMSVSHFQMRKNDDSQSDNYQLKQATLESYRIFGRQLIANYLQHIKLYEKNCLLRQKWLKQIQQIEVKLIRKHPNFIDEKKIQQRFQESFYQIPNYKQYNSLAEIKSHVNITQKSIQNKQIIDFRRHSNNIKKDKQIQKPNFQTFSQIKKNNGYYKGTTNTQITNDIKKQIETDETLQKPYSIFRVSDKKTSILKNCSPNILNFENEGQSKTYITRQKPKLNIQRQLLKKQLSTKLLKKIKIQDTIRNRKGKQKITEKNCEEFLINS